MTTNDNKELVWGCLSDIVIFLSIMYVFPNTCGHSRHISDLENNLGVIQRRVDCLENLLPPKQVKNVIEGEGLEEFYEINGVKYYFVIDGKEVKGCYSR